MDLGDEIGDRELQAVGEEAACLILRRKAELWAKIVEDVGGLRDDQAPSRRKGGAKACGAPPEHRFHRLDAPPRSLLARDIDVWRLGLLKGEADKLAAPLNAWPIVELVGHWGIREGRPAATLTRLSVSRRMRSAALR